MTEQESMAEKMGKKQSEKIQDALKAADFSKCEVPAIPLALSYLVDGMSILVEKHESSGQEKMIEIPTPWGKPIKGTSRDILRLAIVALVAYGIYMNYTDRDERQKVRDDIFRYHQTIKQHSTDNGSKPDVKDSGITQVR